MLLLGDARNNYHAVAGVGRQGDAPEGPPRLLAQPRAASYWDTGDSIVGEYGTHTDGVYECRNLRQLEALRREAGLIYGVATGMVSAGALSTVADSSGASTKFVGMSISIGSPDMSVTSNV